MQSERQAAVWLLSPQAIRERCAAIYRAARQDGLQHFRLHEERLDLVTDYVCATIRANHPDLNIPYHSRWRHFTVGGIDRWAQLAATLANTSATETGRIRTELAIISVLLDAGAGTVWRYHEALSGRDYKRSEGLAVASFNLYRSGVFSSDPTHPLRVDAERLCGLTERQLADGFQVDRHNPLAGLEGRLTLLHGLGDCLTAQAEWFGTPARLGTLFDHLAAQARQHALPAGILLASVLRSLGAIWPGRIRLGGIPLGDVWPHPKAGGDGPGAGLVPFHKLSQWLTYSLVEPMEDAGIQIPGLDELTGLPEYRNGGLFLDLGVLQLKDSTAAARAYPANAEIIVEWRALTVILLDRLAERVRRHFGLDALRLPLVKVLQGGSWSAGRRIARELRSDGAPPLRLDSDGTVF